jgi:uncharacterized protein (DUF983 family)
MQKCPNCQKRSLLNRTNCPKCDFELEAEKTNTLPLIFWTVILLFGVYLIWELLAWIF